MSVLSHLWKDRDPFTRRVRWYCWDLSNRNSGVCLRFEDSHGLLRRWYGEDPIAARADWDAFRGGRTTTELRSAPGKATDDRP